MLFHENRLLADDSHKISYLNYYLQKLGKMSTNLASAAVVIGALKVKSANHNKGCPLLSSAEML